jgi:hypothetical protein
MTQKRPAPGHKKSPRNHRSPQSKLGPFSQILPRPRSWETGQQPQRAPSGTLARLYTRSELIAVLVLIDRQQEGHRHV